MKNLTISIIALFILATAGTFATVRTVSNNAGTKAQYTSLQAAIDAAVAGDTIYVHATINNYGDVTVTGKALVIMGAGYNRPDGVNAAVNSIILNNADNTKINGINCNYISGTNSNYINISNCSIYIGSNSGFAVIICGSNWNLFNNIFAGSFIVYGWGECINIQNNTNTQIFNNIFSYQYASNRVIHNSNSNLTFIFNNLFFSSSFSNISNANFINNIFYGNRYPSGCEYCVFDNNLTYNTDQNTLPYGTNTGSNNIINQNPLFINNSNYSFDYTDNFGLQASSPCIGAGIDSSDIGLYSTYMMNRPWRNLTSNNLPDYSGEPLIPQIRLLNTLPKAVGIGGNINININAVKKD